MPSGAMHGSTVMNQLEPNTAEDSEAAPQLRHREVDKEDKNEANQADNLLTVDVAIIFDAEVNQLLAERISEILTDRQPGLEVQLSHQSQSMALLISANTEWIAEYANKFNFDFNGKGEKDSEADFTRAQRQYLLQQAVESVRVKDESESYGTVQLKSGNPLLANLQTHGIINSFFPLHSTEKLKLLRQKWVPSSPFNIRQPIDEICEYFDTSIAFYFAWLEFYTKWLFIPATVNFLIWNFSPDDETISVKNAPHPAVFMFLFLFNTVWYALFLKFWRRKSSELAFKWGSINQSSTSERFFEEPRPLFVGEPTLNPVTGKATLSYPSWKRNIKFYGVTVPVTATCLWLMMGASVFCFSLQKSADKIAETWNPVVGSFISLLPLILFVLVLNFFNNWYNILAVKLNDLENHFSQNDYTKQLQAKLIVFRFFNGFLPLYYTAFYDSNFERLQDQVAALVMIRQVASNAIEVLGPYMFARYQQVTLQVRKSDQPDKSDAKKDSLIPLVRSTIFAFLRIKHRKKASELGRADVNEKTVKLEQLSQVEREATLFEFDECFEDYLEMFCQLGYVTLFSCVFPPAALWCLVNNLVEIKTDALKMCTACRRPFARQRMRDIGVWTTAFDLLAVGAIVTNVALLANFNVIGQLDVPFGSMSKNSSTLVIVIIIEHAIFALSAFINRVFDDIPNNIQIEISKLASSAN